MNTNNKNEEPAETRDARAVMPGRPTAEPEPESPDPADFRETTEGGYGWGV